MSFAATWVNLENIILSNIRQNEKDEYHMIKPVESEKKTIQMNLFTKQKKTHRHRKQTYAYQKGKGQGEDKLGVWH